MAATIAFLAYQERDVKRKTEICPASGDSSSSASHLYHHHLHHHHICIIRFQYPDGVSHLGRMMFYALIQLIRHDQWRTYCHPSLCQLQACASVLTFRRSPRRLSYSLRFSLSLSSLFSLFSLTLSGGNVSGSDKIVFCALLSILRLLGCVFGCVFWLVVYRSFL